MCAAQNSVFAPQVDFSSETPNRGQQLSKKKKKKKLWIRDIAETDIIFHDENRTSWSYNLL